MITLLPTENAEVTKEFLGPMLSKLTKKHVRDPEKKLPVRK